MNRLICSANEKVVDALIKGGTNLDLANKIGITPLIRAIEIGSFFELMPD